MSLQEKENLGGIKHWNYEAISVKQTHCGIPSILFYERWLMTKGKEG